MHIAVSCASDDQALRKEFISGEIPRCTCVPSLGQAQICGRCGGVVPVLEVVDVATEVTWGIVLLGLGLPTVVAARLSETPMGFGAGSGAILAGIWFCWLAVRRWMLAPVRQLRREELRAIRIVRDRLRRERLANEEEQRRRWLAFQQGQMLLRTAEENLLMETLGAMMLMDPFEFEEYVGSVFRAQGYKVIVTPPSGDDGVELYLSSTSGDLIVVQCKQFSTSNVGPSVVNQIRGAAAAKGATRSMVVTTADFSENAKRIAEEAGVELLNGLSFARLANSVTSSNWAAPASPPIIP